MITLLGGPWNGRRIKDSGAVRIRMAIAREWSGNRPVVGTEVGTAVYEPSADRGRAHWSHNDWDGTLEAIIEA